MDEAKKIGILEDAGKIISEEEKKALDILEIDTEINGHHTEFKFKKAVLDNNFIWELTLEVKSLPRRVNLNYQLHLVLDPTNFNIALNSQYEELKKNQLELPDPKKKTPYQEMERIHKEYEKERKMVWDFTFQASLSQLTNKQTETLHFIVSGEVVREFEKLQSLGGLHRMALALETI